MKLFLDLLLLESKASSVWLTFDSSLLLLLWNEYPFFSLCSLITKIFETFSDSLEDFLL